MTKRTDDLRPSVINPEDFEVADWPNSFHDLEGERQPCDMCGHACRYVVGFRRLSTNDLIWVGQDCAQYLDSDNRVVYEMKKWRTRLANLKKREEEQAEWLARRTAMRETDSDVAEWLEQLDLSKEGTMYAFLYDMVHSYNKWGSLTEKQISAVRNIKVKREEFEAKKAAEPKPKVAVEEGRYFIEGEVLSTRWDTNEYTGGHTKKMLVVMDDGNKVWGTVPNNILDVEKGDRVLFSAKVTRNKEDEHFGYYSRPTKAERI